MLNIKWCLFTAALMACSVGFSHLHTQTSQDPPGLTKRWWDGTAQSYDSAFPDGNPHLHIEYAEDGKTVLVRKEWNYAGALMHSKIVLEDGRIEEKEWYYDGKVLANHIIWLPGGVRYQHKRQFWTNGNIQLEEENTEDGESNILKKTYDELGRITYSYQVLSNADQLKTYFSEGKKVSENRLKGTGDTVDSIFGADEELISRTTVLKLDSSRKEEYFGKSEKLVYLNERFPEKRKSFASVYKKGVLQYKQHFQSGNLKEIHEFTDGKTLARTISYNSEDNAVVKIYREDGTLSLRKEFNLKSEVMRTIVYDLDGKTVVSEKDGGEPEKFDERLFQSVDLQSLIEEDAK